jgi:hypothetical protein
VRSTLPAFTGGTNPSCTKQAIVLHNHIAR